MKDMFRGSRIREATLISVANDSSDFGTMFRGFDAIKTRVGNTDQTFEAHFMQNLSAFLT